MQKTVLKRDEEDFLLCLGKHYESGKLDISSEIVCSDLGVSEEDLKRYEKVFWKSGLFDFGNSWTAIVMDPAIIQRSRSITAEREAARSPSAKLASLARKWKILGWLRALSDYFGPIVGLIGGTVGLLGGLLVISASLKSCRSDSLPIPSDHTTKVVLPADQPTPTTQVSPK